MSQACGRAKLRLCSEGDALCLSFLLGTELAAQADYAEVHCPLDTRSQLGLLVSSGGLPGRTGHQTSPVSCFPPHSTAALALGPRLRR